MSTFLVTYVRKNSFELSNTRTPIHPYTKSVGLMTLLTSLKPKTYTTLGPYTRTPTSIHQGPYTNVLRHHCMCTTSSLYAIRHLAGKPKMFLEF